MRIENTDTLKLKDNKLVIKRGKAEGSIPINPSFIKERLGFFESFINRVWSLFSDNYWKEKVVIVQDSKKEGGKIMYVLESRLNNIDFKPKNSTTQEGSKNNPYQDVITQGLSQRPITHSSTKFPPTLSSASTLAAPIEKSLRLTRSQKQQIINANRLYGWIDELKKEDCRIKKSGTSLSIEPSAGVHHDLTTPSKSTGPLNILGCSFKALEDITSKKWKASSFTKEFNLDYNTYITACNEAIETLNKKAIKSEDDEINLGLLNASLILAKGFQVLEKGGKKDAKLFQQPRFQNKMIIDYVTKYDKFGIKL